MATKRLCDDDCLCNNDRKWVCLAPKRSYMDNAYKQGSSCINELRDLLCSFQSEYGATDAASALSLTVKTSATTDEHVTIPFELACHFGMEVAIPLAPRNFEMSKEETTMFLAHNNGNVKRLDEFTNAWNFIYGYQFRAFEFLLNCPIWNASESPDVFLYPSMCLSRLHAAYNGASAECVYRAARAAYVSVYTQLCPQFVDCIIGAAGTCTKTLGILACVSKQLRRAVYNNEHVWSRVFKERGCKSIGSVFPVPYAMSLCIVDHFNSCILCARESPPRAENYAFDVFGRATTEWVGFAGTFLCLTHASPFRTIDRAENTIYGMCKPGIPQVSSAFIFYSNVSYVYGSLTRAREESLENPSTRRRLIQFYLNQSPWCMTLPQSCTFIELCLNGAWCFPMYVYCSKSDDTLYEIQVSTDDVAEIQRAILRSMSPSWKNALELVWNRLYASARIAVAGFLEREWCSDMRLDSVFASLQARPLKSWDVTDELEWRCATVNVQPDKAWTAWYLYGLPNIITYTEDPSTHNWDEMHKTLQRSHILDVACRAGLAMPMTESFRREIALPLFGFSYELKLKRKVATNSNCQDHPLQGELFESDERCLWLSDFIEVNTPDAFTSEFREADVVAITEKHVTGLYRLYTQVVCLLADMFKDENRFGVNFLHYLCSRQSISPLHLMDEILSSFDINDNHAPGGDSCTFCTGVATFCAAFDPSLICTRQQFARIVGVPDSFIIQHNDILERSRNGAGLSTWFRQFTKTTKDKTVFGSPSYRLGKRWRDAYVKQCVPTGESIVSCRDELYIMLRNLGLNEYAETLYSANETIRPLLVDDLRPRVSQAVLDSVATNPASMEAVLYECMAFLKRRG